MELHFRNLDYVEPPGSLTEILAHPVYSDNSPIELSIFNDHRYAFFFWNKWTQLLLKKNQYTKPPCLVTLDWHQDLLPPNETERKWLNDLDVLNNKNVSLYCWANLAYNNDGQIMAAVYLNLIGNVYVHCRQGRFESDWEDELYIDKYGNEHLIKKFKDYSLMESYLMKSNESNVYFDIDLDFFTIKNPLNGVGDNFTYLTKSAIEKMLHKERPLINWIFERLKGFTIAVEPEHSGGLSNAFRLLNIINKIYFHPPLFSNYGEHWKKGTNWKHLKR